MLLGAKTGNHTNWTPVTLAVTGSLTFLAGLIVVALSITVPANIRLRTSPFNGAVYIGANTCFTCHKDPPGDWSQMLSQHLTQDPLSTPRIEVPVLYSGKALEQVGLNVLANAYAFGAPFTARPNQGEQHYVIQTDAGHVLLGVPWTGSLNSESKDLPASCSGCHPPGQIPGDFMDEPLTLVAAAAQKSVLPVVVTATVQITGSKIGFLKTAPHLVFENLARLML